MTPVLIDNRFYTSCAERHQIKQILIGEMELEDDIILLRKLQTRYSTDQVLDHLYEDFQHILFH